MLFRGEWYFPKAAFNSLDGALISDWTSIEAKTLIVIIVIIYIIGLTICVFYTNNFFF